MYVVPFMLRHLDRLDLGALEMAGDLASFRAAVEAADGPALTIMDGGVPVGAFGILRAGTDGYSWAVFSDALRSRPFALHRTVRREMPEMVREFDAVFGTVRKGWEKGQRWLEGLGFERTRDITLPNGEFEQWVLKPQS